MIFVVYDYLGLAGLKLRTLNYNVFDEFRALLHKV